MTENERQLLDEWLKPVPLYRLGGNDLWGNALVLVVFGVTWAAYGLVAGIIVGYLGFLIGFHGTYIRTIAVCTGLGAVLGACVAIFRLLFVKAPPLDHPEDLSRDSVEVTHYTASEVARIEVMKPIDENYTEGYVFQIEQDEMILVNHLYIDKNQVAERHFPCQTFDIVRLPPKGSIMAIICTGQPITPTRTISIAKDQEWLIQGTRHLFGTLDQLEIILPQQPPKLEEG